MVEALLPGTFDYKEPVIPNAGCLDAPSPTLSAMDRILLSPLDMSRLGFCCWDRLVVPWLLELAPGRHTDRGWSMEGFEMKRRTPRSQHETGRCCPHCSAGARLGTVGRPYGRLQGRTQTQVLVVFEPLCSNGFGHGLLLQWRWRPTGSMAITETLWSRGRSFVARDRGR